MIKLHLVYTAQKLILKLANAFVDLQAQTVLHFSNTPSPEK